ncbi:MAG: Gfo/Idh/MocA family oxidoreductase [Candidatus Lindowbacteria bacterium]|nr:Gfo/Idh/MocA family oxidoreductase [Candidatus Lindowbacteria bacterium]
MTAKTYKLAFIGCGNIAQKHARVLANMSRAEIVGCTDSDPDKLLKFSQENALVPFPDISSLVKKVNPDLFVVLTPSGDHVNQVTDLAGYKKPIIVEKPLALNLDDADKMIETCEKEGTKLFVVKQNRFNRAALALKKVIEEGRLGQLTTGSIRVRWKRDQSYYDANEWRGTLAMDGGVLPNQAAHHIDLLLWMMGPVSSVMAESDTFLVDIEAENTVSAVLRFKNGAIGNIEATTATRPNDTEGSVSILGKRGTIEVSGFAMDKLLRWDIEDPTEEDQNIFETAGKNPDEFGYSHRKYYEAVFDHLDAKPSNSAVIGGFEARKTIALFSAIRKSARTGEKVTL